MAFVVSSRFVVRVVSSARWPSEVGFSALLCGFGKKKKKKKYKSEIFGAGN